MTTMTGADPSFARSLFVRGTDMLGAAEIKAAFGLDVTFGPIPFTEDELRAARLRDEMLVLHPAGITMREVHDLAGNKTKDGKPLFYDTGWYKDEAFFTNDAIRPGWRLVSRAVLSGSRSQNYLQQTATLVGHLNTVYGDAMPKAVAEAIAEFEKEKKGLARLLDSDWREAAKRATELQVNLMFRETPAEALWSLALYERVNGERLLPEGSWSWTNKLSSGGYVVVVGDFGGRGVRVSGDYPGSVGGGLGFRFSRS